MTVHLSCGHEAEEGCFGVCVEFEDEQCIAGEGFVPCTVNAVYCHMCAMDLAAAEERTKVEAQAAEIERLREIVAIMHTAFAAYADSPAKQEAINLAALEPRT